jgi:hypothetical protein
MAPEVQHTNECGLAEEELAIEEEEEYDLLVDNLKPEIQQPISMQGRLKACWPEWEKLHPNKFVTSIIKHGYILQWKDNQPPPAMWHKNGKAAYEHTEFVSGRIQEVESTHVIRECRREDLTCILKINVLPKKDSSELRLIIDGSPLKPYEIKRRFKLEQLWQQGRDIFSGCTHGSVIDISNAFYHIEMAEESKQYIGFEWLGKFYQYNNLPMGIHSAPFVFTEVTKPAVKKWRSLGIRVLKYMDDFPSGGTSATQQRLHAMYMCEHLRSLGWIIKMKKLIGLPEPLTVIPALGTLISFTDQKFYLQNKVIEEIKQHARDLTSTRKVPVLKISQLAGMIVSRSHCLGPAARMRTRAMYKNIEDRLRPHEKGIQKCGWNRFVSLRTNTKAELIFWIEKIDSVNGQPFQRECIHRTLDVCINTDASQPGWGAVINLPPNADLRSSALFLSAQRTLPQNMSIEAIESEICSGIRICGLFSATEARESSNARELLATLYSFKAAIGFLQGMRVDQQMDNMGAVQALGGIIPEKPDEIYGGSNNTRIQELAIAIDDICIEANIDKRTIWIPRHLNSDADYMSKIMANDPFAYTIQEHTFAHLEQIFGHHTIDRFASKYNVRVSPPRYNSKYFEPEAEGLNAFSMHWRLNNQGEQENNWLHPPYLLISRVIRHIQHCKAAATLIIPSWPSASWWPDVVPLLKTNVHINLGWCSDNIYFPEPSQLTHDHLPRGHLIAIRFQ